MQRFPAKTVTAEMASLKGSDTAPPVVVISDGQLLEKSMAVYSLTPEWVAATLRREGFAQREVFLMTADENRQYYIVPKEKGDSE